MLPWSRHRLVCLSLFLSIAPWVGAMPVINELMFHPRGNPVENIGEEWVELYNPSAEAIDLSGWQFTRGIDYRVPDGTVLAADGYLLVASDPTAFGEKYPELNVAVIGGWSGRLSNDSESVRLEDVEGSVVDELDYATQGDWAIRVPSEPEREIIGWVWESPADGEGHTLEKRQPLISISSGMAWSVSTEEGGTPGAVNSVFEEDIAPIIEGAFHRPKIPTPTDIITVSARVVDDFDPDPRVTLFYRVDGSDAWQEEEFSRDGEVYEASMGSFEHEQILEYYIEAKDSNEQSHTWPRPTGNDAREQVTNAHLQVDENYEPGVWEPGAPPRYRIIMTGAERARFKQAQDLSSGFNPVNVAFHATFVSEDGRGVKVRQQIAVRDRGFSSRSGTPVNYHVAFPSGDRWNGRKSIQLNSRFPFSQALGAAMFQLAGLSTTEAVPVEVHMNGQSSADEGSVGYGRYVRAEPVNGDWIERLFPNDGDGNLYRIDDHARLGTGQFTYEGEEASPYDITYLKKTNEDLYDYSDIVDLTYALSRGPAATFREEVEKVVNVEQWLRYLATNALIANLEGGLGTGRADDFAIYRGVEDPRFVLLPHDLDSVMGIGERGFDSSIAMDIFIYRRLGGLQKLLSEDIQTIREYYRVYLEMVDEWFNSETIDPIIDQLFSGWVPEAKIAAAKQFVIDRRRIVLNRIPQANSMLVLTETPERINGRQLTTIGDLRLQGRFHVADVGSIKVLGVFADLSYGDRSSPLEAGRWSWSPSEPNLSPGVNVVEVQYYSEAEGQGDLVHTDTVEIFYRQPVTPVSSESYGEVNADGVVLWSRSESPFHMVSDVTIPSGTQLRIEAGTQVYMESGVRLQVEGTLQVLGGPGERVRFGPHPEAAPEDDPLLPGEQLSPPKWGGIRIVDSLSSENRIQYADIVHAQPRDNQGSIGVVRSECFIDHCTFSGTHYRMVYGRNCSLTVQYCTFPDMFAEEEDPVAIGLDNVAEQLKVESGNFAEIVDDPRFVGGFPVGGHFRVYYNNFYGNKGHNDVLDADSGRWGVSPVLDCRYNHFHGPVGDEHLDLGGDAYVAFNIFENVSKDEFTSDRGYANAISTGDRGSGTTVVVAGNVFRNVEHAINCKVNTATIFEHNTCLEFYGDYLYRSGNIEQDVLCSAINLFVPGDFNPTPGDGAYVGYNVFYGSDDPTEGFPRLISSADSDQPVRPPKFSRLQFYQNLIDPNLEDEEIGELHPGGVFDPQWGEGNVRAFPDTRLSASGLPFGAQIGEWAYVRGLSDTSGPDVSLTIGGPGIFAYRWRLDDAAWSDVIAISPGQFPREAPTVRTATLALNALAEGGHRLEVIGQDFAGNWQTEAEATVVEWQVVDSWTDLVLNEIRASDGDAIEIYNRGEMLDLTGWRISEAVEEETPFFFVDGIQIAAGGYLVVNELTIDRDGDAFFLIDPEGVIRDEIQFGSQPRGYTLGRVGDEWRLCKDTLGAPNETVVLGPSSALQIREILAASSQASDWIELYNSAQAPIALAGIRLTDNRGGDPDAHVFPAYTFLGPLTYWQLAADGTTKERSVNFALDAEGESLSLTSEDGFLIDHVLISPQTEDRSMSWTEAGMAFFPEAPTNTFAEWAGDLLPESDLDEDGLSALMEYALGRDPARKESESPLTLTRESRFRLHASQVVRPDITYLIETSEDLQTWSTLVSHSILSPGEEWPPAMSQIPLAEGGQVLEFELPNASGKAYVRLRVALP